MAPTRRMEDIEADAASCYRVAKTNELFEPPREWLGRILPLIYTDKFLYNRGIIENYSSPCLTPPEST